MNRLIDNSGDLLLLLAHDLICEEVIGVLVLVGEAVYFKQIEVFLPHNYILILFHLGRLSLFLYLAW